MKTRLLIATITTPIPSALWWLGGYEMADALLLTLGHVIL